MGLTREALHLRTSALSLGARGEGSAARCLGGDGAAEVADDGAVEEHERAARIGREVAKEHVSRVHARVPAALKLPELPPMLRHPAEERFAVRVHVLPSPATLFAQMHAMH